MLGKALALFFYPWKKLKGVVSRWSVWLGYWAREAVCCLFSRMPQRSSFSLDTKGSVNEDTRCCEPFVRDPPQAKVDGCGCIELGSLVSMGMV